MDGQLRSIVTREPDKKIGNVFQRIYIFALFFSSPPFSLLSPSSLNSLAYSRLLLLYIHANMWRAKVPKALSPTRIRR